MKTIQPSQVERVIYDLVKDEPMEKILTRGVLDADKLKKLVKEKL